MTPTVCAIDVGTTLIKATLRRGDEPPLARATVRFPNTGGDDAVRGDGAGGHDAVWGAFADAVRQVTQGQHPDAVIVSAQMSGLSMVDQHDRPLGPLLPGVITRSTTGVPDLSASGSAQREITTVAKYLWWRAQPGAAPPARVGGIRVGGIRVGSIRVGSIKDYLLHRLTGRWVTDPATASASGCYDIAARSWSAALLAEVGLPVAALPEVVDMERVVGTVGAVSAADCGLPVGVPVCCGLGDGPAANLSAGATRPGILCFSRGTTLVARVLTAKPPHVDLGLPLFTHHVHGDWCCVGVRFVTAGPDRYTPTGDPDTRLDQPGVFDYLRPFLKAFDIQEIRPVGGTPVRFPADWPVHEVPADAQDGTLGMTRVATGWTLEGQQS